MDFVAVTIASTVILSHSFIQHKSLHLIGLRRLRSDLVNPKSGSQKSALL